MNVCTLVLYYCALLYLLSTTMTTVTTTATASTSLLVTIFTAATTYCYCNCSGIADACQKFVPYDCFFWLLFKQM